MAAGLAIGAAAYMGARKVVVVGGCTAAGTFAGAALGLMTALGKNAITGQLGDPGSVTNDSLSGIFISGTAGAVAGFSYGLSL